jgi:hypothetical protein
MVVFVRAARTCLRMIPVLLLCKVYCADLPYLVPFVLFMNSPRRGSVGFHVLSCPRNLAKERERPLSSSSTVKLMEQGVFFSNSVGRFARPDVTGFEFQRSFLFVSCIFSLAGNANHNEGEQKNMHELRVLC